jgi:hypothetical protein
LDRIYRIFRIILIFHHFPEESDETQSRLKAGEKQIVVGSGSFLFKACHSRAGGNPEMFCWKSWMPACAGMTGKTPRLLK